MLVSKGVNSNDPRSHSPLKKKIYIYIYTDDLTILFPESGKEREREKYIVMILLR